MKKHVIMLIHGISPDITPGDPSINIRQFYENVRALSPELQSRIPSEQVIAIQWGHPDASGIGSSPNERPDLLLMQAQNQIIEMIYPHGSHGSPPSMEWISTELHRRLVIPGIGDMIYANGSDGSAQIRDLIYSHNLIPRLLQIVRQDTVCLHVIAISLGVTIGFEFLRSIFASHGGTAVANGRFGELRTMVGTHKLQLGSFTCAASQLPLLLLRDVDVVKSLAAGNRLDPSLIGISGTDTRWLLFHDENDILSMPTKPLFSPDVAIKEIAVNNDHGSLDFVASHTGYWQNQQVIEETRDFLSEATSSFVD